MTHPTRAFSGSIINRFTGSKIVCQGGFKLVWLFQGFRKNIKLPILALYCHFAFFYIMRHLLPCCPIRRRKYWACHINQSHLWDSQCMVQGLSIYRLAPCTEDCSQKISKTFSHNNLESVLLFCTFEPKKCKCAFRVAVSACTLKILCCGYNMATIKKDKKIKDYDTRSCSGMVIFPSDLTPLFYMVPFPLSH